MAVGWDIRRVYLYLVSFTTLLMAIIGTILIIHNLIDVLYPNNDPYIFKEPIAREETTARHNELKKTNPDITLEEVKKDIEEQRKTEQERQRVWQIRNNYRNLLKSLAMVLVALPIYFYHWRKIQSNEGPKPAGP